MRLRLSDPCGRLSVCNGLRKLLVAAWLGLLWPTAASAWSLVVEQGRVGLALPDIRTGGWEVTGSQADVLPAINASEDTAVVSFSPTSLVVTDRLAYTGADQPLLLQELRTDLSNVTLTLDYGASGSWPDWVAVKGEVKIDASRIEHPALVPQAWSFQGSMEGRLADLNVQGALVSESGLAVDLDVQLGPDGAISISVNSGIEGPEDVRALAETFTGWPELLTVDTGSARVSAEFRMGTDDGLELNGGASLENVSGVFNRTAFAGLTGDVLAALEGDRMTAQLQGVTVDQVNPGIPVNAIRLTSDYAASVARPMDGRLRVQEAAARFLEGAVQIPSGVYDLEGGSGRIPVEMQDLSLARLMAVYPAEGLEGSGLLSGRIPITYSDGGIQVKQGRVSAEAPGGRLQLPADRLQAMLGGNQAMDVVVQALQNFHYSVLFSTVDYDETGKLILGLRMEGKNPELRGGQPVVLNVNLEDDIPALLTSLQLSGRVNEAVTERVRELLQQSGQEVKP
jgi:hypothetical protein